MHKRITLNRMHRWAGLTAAIWLVVLGGSGFILDHREDWRWLWQSGISPQWLPETINEKSRSAVQRLYQVVDESHAISGGPAGLWWREDQLWQETRFPRATPWIRDLTRVSDEWWIATDNGLWLSRDMGRTAQPVIFNSLNITSLVYDGNSLLWGVVDRSSVFSVNPETLETNWFELAPPGEAELPESIDLSRLVHDLHFGRGLFEVTYSLLWNDVSAIALITLPLGGVLYWWLPKIWRRRRLHNEAVNKRKKQRFARWLYRTHAPIVGLVAAFPIVYLSLTGIVLDHATGLRSILKKTDLSQSLLPPVYSLTNWQNEIYAILPDKDNPRHFSLGTRLGLFSTSNGGQNWQREKWGGNRASFIWTADQIGGQGFIGGMGGPNYRQDKERQWRSLSHGAHMPSDITMNSDGQTLWKTSKGLMLLQADSKYKKLHVLLPEAGFVPWFYVIDGLHSGMLIHPQWKWINDLVAILAIVLVVTGLLRWWRVKWL